MAVHRLGRKPKSDAERDLLARGATAPRAFQGKRGPIKGSKPHRPDGKPGAKLSRRSPYETPAT